MSENENFSFSNFLLVFYIIHTVKVITIKGRPGGPSDLLVQAYEVATESRVSAWDPAAMLWTTTTRVSAWVAVVLEYFVYPVARISA